MNATKVETDLAEVIAATPNNTASPAAYFMRSPAQQYTDDIARRKVEAFVAGEA